MAILQTIAFVIYIIAAILIVLSILLQEGKGGGLAGLGGAQAEATFGATNPLRRFTVVMAVIFFFLAGFIDYASKGREIEIKEEAQPEAVSGEDEAPEVEKKSGEEGELEAAEGKAPEDSDAPGIDAESGTGDTGEAGAAAEPVNGGTEAEE